MQGKRTTNDQCKVKEQQMSMQGKRTTNDQCKVKEQQMINAR